MTEPKRWGRRSERRPRAAFFARLGSPTSLAVALLLASMLACVHSFATGGGSLGLWLVAGAASGYSISGSV